MAEATTLPGQSGKRLGPLTSLILSDRGARWTLGLLLAFTILVPVLNTLPESSAFHVPTYMVSLLGKYLCYALLALSIDLIWGYCGILSLGHGTFFALGGYAMGMYLMRQIGDRGVYGNPDLPDFMVFLNWPELPWYWLGFDNFFFAMFMVALVPGLLAFVFGWFAFRSRVTGVYFSIITQAMTYAMMLAFFRNDMGFGGNNGLTDFKDILGSTCVPMGCGWYCSSRGIALAWLYPLPRADQVAPWKGPDRDPGCGKLARFIGRVEYYKLFVFPLSWLGSPVRYVQSGSSIPVNSRRSIPSRW